MSNSIPFALRSGEILDPFPVHKFWVAMDNIVVAEFKECGGLRMEREITTIEEGGVNGWLTHLPGRIKYSNITLKYGVMESNALWDWFQEGLLDGKVNKQDFDIVLHHHKNGVVKKWTVHKGFPVKWEGPAFNVEQGQVAVETLEIAYSWLELNLK